RTAADLDKILDDARNRGAKPFTVRLEGDDLTSAHHPDVLASLLAGAFGEAPDRLSHELNTGRYRSRRGLAREHIMHVICLDTRAHVQTLVESPATEDLGIDQTREFR